MRRLCLFFLSVTLWLWRASPVQADSFVIHAVVPPQASSFQLAAGVEPNLPVAPQNTVLTYTITYGSYLYYQADIMVIQASWDQGLTGNSLSPIDVATYVSGSATVAEGGSQPVIDVANRRITWTVSPVPRAADQTVSFQLKTTNLALDNQLYHFGVTFRLISSGVELPPSTLTQQYQYKAAPITSPPSFQPSIQPPSPTAKSPETVSPPGIFGILPAIGQVIKNGYHALTNTPVIGPAVQQVGQAGKSIAKSGGGIASAPVPVVLIGLPAYSLLGNILPYLNWTQLPSLLATLFLRRKRHPWGVVYDSLTKEPLDPVILTLTDPKGKQYQAISDIFGRYQFLVEPGDYTLIAQKSHYQFPSAKLAGQTADTVYDDLYFGQPLHITGQSNINVNIPLDPVDADWNQAEKQRMGLARHHYLPKSWRQWIFGLGATWSAAMWLADPNTINTSIIIIYSLLFAGLVVLSRRRPWGVVRMPGHQPLRGAVVNISDLDHPMIKRPPVVTRETGRYSFLVDKGQYQVSVSLKQSDGSYQVMAATPSIHIRSKYGQIRQDVNVPDQPEKLVS